MDLASLLRDRQMLSAGPAPGLREWRGWGGLLAQGQGLTLGALLLTDRGKPASPAQPRAERAGPVTNRTS